MAITFLKVLVSNPENPERAKGYEFLVDLGAVYSAMPVEELEKLGIKPTSSEDFILANGETIHCPVGNAFFQYKGKLGATPVVFWTGGCISAWSNDLGGARHDP